MKDTDNPNLNNAAHDRHEWWEAKQKEHDARVREMSAEEQMEANNAWNDFRTEMDGAADWTEAKWDQFVAKVEQWWNKGEVKADEAV